MEIVTAPFIFTMASYIALLFLLHELTRKYVKGATIIYILAIFTMPIWGQNLEGWFRWGKTLMVILPTAFLTYARFANQAHKKEGFLSKPWVHWTFWLLLALNIFWASWKDVELGNWMNAVSGFILIAAMPIPMRNWRFDRRKQGSADLITDFPLIWCFLYTTWNACFVYAEHPGYLASSICILIVPEIYSIVMKRSDIWVSARTYTLCMHLLLRACCPEVFDIIDTTAWASQDAVEIWGLINIVMHVPFLIWWFAKGYKVNVHHDNPAELPAT